ncbi:MAG: histidinol dehydrogenase, partial [Clostridia bacterium]|nr:histidinol dehydrogenase [Clostridia bacterium]
MIKTFYYGRDPDEAVFGREQPLSRDVSDTVREIITDVARRGDDALRDYTEKFDGVRLSDIEVSREEMSEALGKVDSGLLGVFHRAAENITRFHSEQVRKGFELKDGGITLGQKVTPLARVGLYVPGGTAAYPSTVLMNVIPAKIAGCGEIIITTPPGRDGKVNPNVLAAAAVAGADRIFKAGGAQAIAALAYGTETVPAVDKITGPGNAYVAEAKRQVFGMVSIDMIAGPSEILVIADGENDPKVIAADLLSQAEHDKNAMSVLVTDSEELAALVTCEIEDELSRLSREEIARASIDKNGRIIIVKDMAEAVKVSDRIAPEHLELCVADPFGL